MKTSYLRFWRKCPPAAFALLALGIVHMAGLGCSAALAQTTSTGEKKSWTDSMSSGFKKLGDNLTPKSSTPKVKTPENDGVSLKSKGKPGPELYVAVARLYEDGSKWAEAEQQYQLALKLKADYLPALLGYAQLKEQMGQPDEALRIYQRAAKAHPRDAAVFNNMGLYYARLGRSNEAVGAHLRQEPKGLAAAAGAAVADGGGALGRVTEAGGGGRGLRPGAV